MPNFQTLQLAVAGGVATLTLNRPDRGNAVDADMHRELLAALSDIAADDGIRVVLLSGAGKTFSAGGDFAYIRQLRSDDALRAHSFDETMGIFDALTSLKVPVVAAVHGHAMGFGATLVSLSDIAVAWADAKIGDPHVKVGLVAGDGGVIGWSSAIGMNRARRYLLTGEPVTGREAYAMGLVSDLAETPDETRELARAIAERIAALPPIAVQGTKRAFAALAAVRNGDSQSGAFEAELRSLMSDDCEEALQAMEQRRPGVYRNR